MRQIKEKKIYNTNKERVKSKTREKRGKILKEAFINTAQALIYEKATDTKEKKTSQLHN